MSGNERAYDPRGEPGTDTKPNETIVAINSMKKGRNERRTFCDLFRHYD